MKNILFSILPTLIIFLFLEILIRISSIYDEEYGYANDVINWRKISQIGKEWGWYFLPNTSSYLTQPDSGNLIEFSIKAIPGYEKKGMRDDGFNPGKDNCAVVFGDSYTFGSGIEQSEIWCERMEEKYNNVDFLNLANGGGISKAVDQYTLLKNKLPSHQTVIYAMWLGNEFIDNYSYPKIKNGEIRLPENKNPVNSILLKSKFLFSMYHSASSLRELVTTPESNLNQYVTEDNPFSEFFYRIKYSLYKIKLLFRPGNEKLINSEKKYTVSTVKGLDIKDVGLARINPKNIYLTHYLKRNLDSVTQAGIDNTKKYLLELKKLVSPANFVLILIPFREQVYAEKINERVIDYLDVFDPMKPNDIISEFCIENSIEFYDLTPHFIENNKKQFYFHSDPHFNSTGANYFFELTDKVLNKDQVYIP